MRKKGIILAWHAPESGERPSGGIWIWKRGRVVRLGELPVLVLGAWNALARRFGDLDQALIVFPKRDRLS
jgi:hypothetical protein